MNETPKRAGVLTWMLLTGAVAAPATAQEAREAAMEPTTQPTAVDERSPAVEEAEGSGEPVMRERHREQQAKRIAPDRQREAHMKATE